MSKLYMLVGLPATGKSTWLQNYFYTSTNNEHSTVISTDKILELICEKYDMTYNELFNNISYSFAEKMMYTIADKKIKENKIIFWDQTNLTIKSRKRKLDLFSNNYDKICVYFHIPLDHEQRLIQRDGKIIPMSVIEIMKKKFEEPTLSEGFTNIIHVNKD